AEARLRSRDQSRQPGKRSEVWHPDILNGDESDEAEHIDRLLLLVTKVVGSGARSNRRAHIRERPVNASNPQNAYITGRPMSSLRLARTDSSRCKMSNESSMAKPRCT